MTQKIYKPVIVIDELGELGLAPDGGVINIGGVVGPNFTVGGKSVVLSDGTTSGDGTGGIVAPTPIYAYEHIQQVESDSWNIHHLKGSKRVQISLWDEEDEAVWSHSTKIIDNDNVLVKFNSPIKGRAILMIF